MNPARRIAIGVFALSMLTVIGAVGFFALEGLMPLDALYLTIATLTTVGYGDLVPTTQAGRIFSIVLMVGGVGTALYLITFMAGLVMEGQLRDFLGRAAMERKVEHLSDHVVVCGYGRLGRVVVDELRQAGVRVAVVDSNPDREPELRRLGVPYLIGSALEDDVLEQAAVRRARAMVIATPSDANNVFITLSAREKSATIPIFARGESDAGLRRLELAGATRALSAYHTGARRLAASILQPSVVDFLDLSMGSDRDDVAIEEIAIAPGSALVDQSIRDVEQIAGRFRIIALKREGEATHIAPSPIESVSSGDLLVVIGTRTDLDRLARTATG